MGHDVYICYDEKDGDIADEIYHMMKENNIEPWIDSKNMPSGDSVDIILNAISSSKCFLLILSKASIEAHHVINEVDIAFSREIPILVFNLDNSKVEGNMEFILSTQKILPSYSSPKKQLRSLVEETSDIIGKPAGGIKINSTIIKLYGKINPRRIEDNIKKFIKIAVPVVAVLVLIYLFVILPMGQHTTDDGKFSINLTGVESDGVKYIVHGELFNKPSDADKYVMNVRFYDDADNMVFEVNSTADEFKSGTIWQGDLLSDNATHVEFKLTDFSGKVISKDECGVG